MNNLIKTFNINYLSVLPLANPLTNSLARFLDHRLVKRFVLFLALVGFNQIQAQDYKPLLDYTNEWHFTNCYFGCLTDIYYTDGDTLVDGNNYKILDGYHYISRTFLLREEVATQRVYLRRLSNNGIGQEYLLYDFSLQEGATFEMFNPITPFPENAGRFIVDSIRSRVLEDGQAYKHYYFSPAPTNTVSDNNCVWIEGVGSLSIINAPSGLPDINGVGHLSCFFKEGALFYTNLDSISGCSPTLGNKPPSLAIKPKVVADTQAQLLHIQANVPFDGLKLYNLNGQLIAEQTTAAQKSYSWPLNLSKGVYFLAIRSSSSGQETVLNLVW